MSLAKAILYAFNNKVTLPKWLLGDKASQAQSTQIAGLAQIEQVKFIMSQLQKVLDNDGNFDDFVKMAENNELDITLPKHRLDNIYRTNVQMAYAYGRYRQQQANKKNKPYLKYSAVNDSRTRPSHRALDGVIRPIDDPFWDRHTPPIDFRCRCVTVALTDKQAKQQGITSVLPNVELSDDFVFNPKDYGRRGDKLIAFLSLDDVKVVQNKQTKTAWQRLKQRLNDSLKWLK